MVRDLSSLQHTLFRDAPFLLLMEIYDSTDVIIATNLAKKINVTYSHVVKVLNEFHREKLVSFDRHGRVKKIQLTTKGQEIALCLKKAVTLMG